ncbi:MAG: AAA family ATPase [Nanopusillaceae archaeon]
MNYTLSTRGGIYNLVFSDPHGINVRFTRVVEDSDGIHADMTILSAHSPKPYILQTRLNLMSSRTRAQLARLLNERYPIGEMVWLSVVEAACLAVVNAYRSPTRFIHLGSSPASPVSYVIRPLIVQGEPTVIFGPGGSGKSYLALLCSVLVATGSALPGLLSSEIRGPVLYVDWESSEAELKRRLNAICSSLGFNTGEVPVYYLHGNGPFPGNEQIADAIVELDPVLVVVDSLGLAAGGPLNDPHTPVCFYRAVRQLEANVLVLAHTPKHIDDRVATIFGSAYFSYLARSVWEVQCTNADQRMLVNLFHRKFNLGKLHEPISIEFNFGERLVIQPAQPPAMADEHETTLDRILKVLDSAPFPLRPAEIAEILGLPVSTVTRVLIRGVDKGKVERLERGRYRLARTALVSDDPPAEKNSAEAAKGLTEEGKNPLEEEKDSSEEIPF